jgi:hypothetical protein
VCLLQHFLSERPCIDQACRIFRMQIHVDLSMDCENQIKIFSKSKRDSTMDRYATLADHSCCPWATTSLKPLPWLLLSGSLLLQSRQYKDRLSSKPKWSHIQSGRMRSTVSHLYIGIPYSDIQFRFAFLQSSGGYVASSNPPRGASDDGLQVTATTPDTISKRVRALIRKQLRTTRPLSPKKPDTL